MKLKSPHLGKGPRLELVSLMDVMFLVLVFFVYATFEMAVHKGTKVQLPRAAGEKERGERIVLTITKDDAAELNGRSMPMERAVAEIARLSAAKPDLPVLISGDAKASLGAGIGALSELRKSGVKKASFQVSGAGKGE